MNWLETVFRAWLEGFSFLLTYMAAVSIAGLVVWGAVFMVAAIVFGEKEDKKATNLAKQVALVVVLPTVVGMSLLLWEHDRTKDKQLQETRKLNECLERQGIEPQVQIFDNSGEGYDNE